jgi:hypothetical protein
VGKQASTIDRSTLSHPAVSATSRTITIRSQRDADGDSGEREAGRERLITAMADAVTEGSVARLRESR